MTRPGLGSRDALRAHFGPAPSVPLGLQNVGLSLAVRAAAPSGPGRVYVDAAPDQEALQGAREELTGLLEAGAPPTVRFREAV